MTTEELKREMYRLLQDLKDRQIGTGAIYVAAQFESAMEAVFEELRKDLDFASKSADLTNVQIRKILQERDELRNRLQAFEFANKAAGEELRKAQEIIKRQREAIGELYVSSRIQKT